MQATRITLLSTALTLALAATAGAQISFKGRPQTLTWPSDCSTPVTFVNDTGVDLCDLWTSIGNDEQENHPELYTITVHGPGNTWNVDDNEDGDDDDVDDNDTIDESADIGSQPPDNSNGWHRAQAHESTDCIPPGGTFTITLCDVQNGS